MSKIIIFTLFICALNLTNSNIADDRNLSEESLKIKTAFEELIKDSSSTKKQLEFIDAFPQDWSTFLKVFHPDDFDELYSFSYYYINKLQQLAGKHQNRIGKLLIGLARNAHWDADAPGYLQKTLANYCVNHTDKFIELLKNEDDRNIKNIITFLADVENHKVYEEYQLIIDNLIKLNKKDIALKFEKARTERINLIDH